MKIRIFDGPAPKEKELLLKLIPSEGTTNTVDLVAVDENGRIVRAGHILNISTKGIRRHFNMSRELGLPVDGVGDYVKVLN